MPSYTPASTLRNKVRVKITFLFTISSGNQSTQFLAIERTSMVQGTQIWDCFKSKNTKMKHKAEANGIKFYTVYTTDFHNSLMIFFQKIIICKTFEKNFKSIFHSFSIQFSQHISRFLWKKISFTKKNGRKIKKKKDGKEKNAKREKRIKEGKIKEKWDHSF